MKIRTKLLLALGMLPILLVVLVVTGLLQISHLNKTSDSLETTYDIAILSEQIHTDIKNEGMHLRNLVVYTDENSVQQEISSLQIESENIKQNISLLESKATTKEQIELIKDLKELNDDFIVYSDQVISLVSNNSKAEAIQLINETSSEIQSEFFDVITEITTTFNSHLESSLQEMVSNFESEIIISSVILGMGILLIIAIMFRIIWSLSTRLSSMSNVMKSVANGNSDLSTKLQVKATDEIDEVASSFNRMTESLEIQMDKEQILTWAKTNIADITTSLSGAQDLETLGRTFLSKVVPLVDSSHAVFYVKDINEQSTDQSFKLISSYAFKERKHVSNVIKPGEGLIGQAILEKSPIILTDVPSDYVQVSSGLGEATPLFLYVLPISFEGEVKAVLEIASFKAYTESQQDFMEELTKDLGIILESVMSRIQLAKLLEESQTMMEEIQAQSEELQNQQEELRATNEELEEQTQALRQSEERLQEQQEELEQINRDLEEKTKNLEEQNKRFEQTNKEVEKAKAELEVKAEQLALSSKYKSEFLANMSHELRTPLNSLLILSKLLTDNADKNLTTKQVEYAKTIYSSGKDLLTLINDILDLAKIESGKTEISPSEVRIKDIVEFVENNFIPVANEKGLDFNINVQENVSPSIFTDGMRLQQILKNLLSNAFKFTTKGHVTLEIKSIDSMNDSAIAFSIMDTGIGIPKDKMNLIFEAFQQVDGTTNRKFGGTGLGLSISKQIASLLGGEIQVESKEGHGSTFTFIVSHYQNFDEQVDRNLARYEVAASIDQLVDVAKEANDKNSSVINNVNSMRSNIKRLLIVDDDLNQRNSLMELIGDMDFVMKAVSSGREAIEELKVNHFDCIILDLGLKDTTGFDLLDRVKADLNNIKVIIYTGRDLTSKEELLLNQHTPTIIIKNEHSPQRLKEELELFLNESKEKMKNNTHEVIESNVTADLSGKKILLVDDDVRNVFALSSIIEQSGMDISFAENGYESIENLKKDPNIDLVLMDIMMPEMDGYEAIKRIRSMPQFKDLPIIAVTAKAMKEDREKCLEVGASDYLVKPIEPEQLISLIKVWLYQ